ncbi:hypothetical protein OROMI_019308 [Orobanche minor]
MPAAPSHNISHEFASEVRFEYVDGHFVDNERQCSIEQRNVLDDASFDHVMVQLMPTQPVDPRSLGLKRNRKEGGDRGRGGDRGIGRGRKRGRGNVRGVPYRGGPLNVMDYSSVVADPCGNWFISGSSRGVVTLWDLRFINSWQYSLPCPIEKMCLFDPPSGTPLSIATRMLVYVAAVCNEVSLCNAENGSCHQGSYEHGGEAQVSQDANLKPSMDIFAVGCVLEGRPLHELSQLLAYRRGQYDPTQHLENILDSGIRKMILHMIQLDPESRCSAESYLQNNAGFVFPCYFSPFLHKFYSLLNPLSCNARVLACETSFQEILRQMLGNRAVEDAISETETSNNGTRHL